MHQGSGAHRARFNCNKQLTVSKTVIAHVRAGVAQRDYLCVSGRIAIRDVAIPTAANDLSCEDDDGSYGHFSSFERALSAAQCFLHPEFTRNWRGFRSGVRHRLELIVRWHANIVPSRATRLSSFPQLIGAVEVHGPRSDAAFPEPLPVRPRAQLREPQPVLWGRR